MSDFRLCSESMWVLLDDKTKERKSRRDFLEWRCGDMVTSRSSINIVCMIFLGSFTSISYLIIR